MVPRRSSRSYCFFFFNDTATTEIYTLSLHDALPTYDTPAVASFIWGAGGQIATEQNGKWVGQDRKSTRLNSSHVKISYAVFCLKKKKATRARSPNVQSHASTTRRC